ncbi:RNA methyltransferase [Nitrosomonas sp.]|uniref:TrmH family RNA methyltransferase n=1 Tax=Nitrosomonas sp. TaxID=42353 RepID=UPI00263922B3|nr:RNA methyltransferase [Nitrosomonas sp.]MCW5600828.1 RNA methyltransferase [Nitrosomonas sp.]
MHTITSREHALFKQLIKLEKSARQRRSDRLTLLDGAHLIQAYRRAQGLPTKLIVSESGYQHPEIRSLVSEISKNAEVHTVMFSDGLFKQVSPVKTPTGIIALITIPTTVPNTVNDHLTFCLLLEAIQDPGNLGSILRSAAAAGVSDIYLSDGCADVWSPKTLRAAMGAHFALTLYEASDLVQVIQRFKNSNGKVIAATLRAPRHLYQVDLKGTIALVFGNEGAGLSQQILDVIDEQIAIPMQGNTESLNVAAAAAICFFEKMRQQYYGH